MSLCIHLGAHKTATTHLQAAFDHAAPHLAGQGIGWLGPRQLRQDPTDLRHLLDDPEQMPWRALRAVEGLAQAGRDRSRLIISEELILGDTTPERLFATQRLYPMGSRRLGSLVAMIDAGPATLFLAVREPSDFLVSTFGEELRMGRQVSPAGYLAGLDAARLCWSDLVERLLSVGGVEGMVCWRYEDLAAVRPQIMRRLVGAEASAMMPNPKPRRVGWSAKAYAAYRAGAPEDKDQHQRREAARLALEAYPRRSGEAGLSAAIAENDLPVAGDYAADCAQLAAMDRVTFLRPEGAGKQG